MEIFKDGERLQNSKWLHSEQSLGLTFILVSDNMLISFTCPYIYVSHPFTIRSFTPKLINDTKSNIFGKIIFFASKYVRLTIEKQCFIYFQWVFDS